MLKDLFVLLNWRKIALTLLDRFHVCGTLGAHGKECASL